jgi:hypothetical protein
VKGWGDKKPLSRNLIKFKKYIDDKKIPSNEIFITYKDVGMTPNKSPKFSSSLAYLLTLLNVLCSIIQNMTKIHANLHNRNRN